MENILYFIDPISIIERRISRVSFEKENMTSQNLEKMIEEYSQLVEYYSSRDQ